LSEITPELIQATKNLWYVTAGLVLTDEEAIRLIKGESITGAELQTIENRSVEALTEAGIPETEAKVLVETKEGSEVLHEAVKKTIEQNYGMTSKEFIYGETEDLAKPSPVLAVDGEREEARKQVTETLVEQHGEELISEGKKIVEEKPELVKRLKEEAVIKPPPEEKPTFDIGGLVLLGLVLLMAKGE
jgi:hypothetical protein